LAIEAPWLSKRLAHFFEHRLSTEKWCEAAPAESSVQAQGKNATARGNVDSQVLFHTLRPRPKDVKKKSTSSKALRDFRRGNGDADLKLHELRTR